MNPNGFEMRRFGFWAIGPMILISLGCASENPDLIPQSRPLLPDVPLPMKFELVESDSHEWTDGQLRYVHHLFKGSEDLQSVLRFYEKQMPIHHWTLQEKQLIRGRTEMDFVKSTEKARVSVYRGSFWKIYVHISIWPSSGGAAPKD